MMQVLSDGVVYRNPAPHLRSVHAWHPSLVSYGPDHWISSFDLAEASEAHNYRTYLSESRDDGKTWTQPRPLIDESVHLGSLSLRVSRFEDGSLHGFGGLMDVRPTMQGILNPQTFGYTPMQLGATSSSDGGLTWTQPLSLDLPLTGCAFETCHSLLQLRDGRVLAPTCTWRTWTGDEPHGMQAVAFESLDQGQSWSGVLRVRDDWADGITNWEQSLVELGDGTLLGVTWRYQVDTGATFPTEFVAARDGRTFLHSGLTGFLAQTVKLVALPDDSVVAVYRRHDRPGLWADHARITWTSTGMQWETIARLLVWDGAASGMTGASGHAEQLSALRFGYPSPVVRDDGDIEVLYWRRVEEINEIANVRLRV